MRKVSTSDDALKEIERLIEERFPGARDEFWRVIDNLRLDADSYLLAAEEQIEENRKKHYDQ